MAKPKREPPTLLIDADVIRYLMAFKNTKTFKWDDTEDADELEVLNPERAKVQVDDLIHEFCEKFGTDKFVLPLSCRVHNFRKDVEPTYKLARHERAKPALWAVIDEYLLEHYGDKIVERYGLEGDDVLGTLATHPNPKRAPGPRIVISIDKDLQTIPCRLFNPNKPDVGVRTISEHDADLFWMHQTLTGDTTDNYTGCPGIGPKKADAALLPIHEAYRDAPPAEHLAALWEAVLKVYETKELTPDHALTQARLARILRHGDVIYKTNEVKLWQP
jgi:5'-3' exonuclease